MEKNDIKFKNEDEDAVFYFRINVLQDVYQNLLRDYLMKERDHCEKNKKIDIKKIEQKILYLFEIYESNFKELFKKTSEDDENS